QPTGRLNEQIDDTPYMSPERTYGPTEVDIRSDIYSLGSILYALLTGRPPFEAPTQGETVHQIRNDEPIKPKKYQPLMHALYEEILLKMLAKAPRHRPKSPAELLSGLCKVAQSAGLPEIAAAAK